VSFITKAMVKLLCEESILKQPSQFTLLKDQLVEE